MTTPPPPPPADHVYPIPLNDAQELAAKQWAADDKLWTTQETVEFNLLTFARLILKCVAVPPERPADPWYEHASVFCALSKDGEKHSLCDGWHRHGGEIERCQCPCHVVLSERQAEALVTKKLRKIASIIYVEVNESVADDIAKACRDAADLLDRRAVVPDRAQEPK